MNPEMITPFLPLGSILKLQDVEDESLLYLIVARAIAKNENGEIYSRYRVAPHPYGDIPTQEIISISASQIIEVRHEGYKDEIDEKFLKDLLQRMSKGPIPEPKPEESSVVEDDIEIKQPPVPDDNEDEELKKDPFYKFR